MRDTSALQLADGVRAFLLFASGVVLARMLKPTDYGNYGLILALASLPAIFLDLGVDKTVLKGLSESRATRDEARATEMILFGSSASLLSAALILSLGLPLLPLLAHINLRGVLLAILVLGSAPPLISRYQARGAALAITLGFAGACAIDLANIRRPLRPWAGSDRRAGAG